MSRWTRVGLTTVAAIYVAGLGILGGVAIERVRDDQARQVQVKRAAEAARRAREQAMEMERRALTEQPGPMPWRRTPP